MSELPEKTIDLERIKFKEDLRDLLAALFQSPVLLYKAFWKAGLSPMQIDFFRRNKIKGWTTAEIAQFKNYDLNVLQCLLIKAGSAEKLKNLSPGLIWYLGAYDFDQITMLFSFMNIDEIMGIETTKIGTLGRLVGRDIGRILDRVGRAAGLQQVSAKELSDIVDSSGYITMSMLKGKLAPEQSVF
ncbi:MAG: hypothetical protein V1936_00170 [Patescibacteria group bacterium]